MPLRVASDPKLENKNSSVKLGLMVQNIKSNLREYVRPVSVPFKAVARDVMASDSMAHAAASSADQR